MPHLNIEIKASCPDPDRIRAILNEAGSDFRGTDHQVDTYFRVPNGRLKLRQGTIERALIQYNRPNQAGPKNSQVVLVKDVGDGEELKLALTNSLGVLVVVDKHREIHFVDNVKLHVDMVEGLGSFVEIEAIDFEGTIGEERLREQCNEWIERLGILPEQLLERSYSDMLME
ncbi:class IV adenylate cyclase [bacterium]|nr:class IV adenylate cyclase [bacterium]